MTDLSAVTRKFVLHWGEMGTRWGINRTVAQIHALLFISPRPLSAEEIAAALSIARSNVSTSLRELQGWGVVKTVHALGDRRDHFESMKNVWEMFRVILDERKKRECDPTLALLRECAADAKASPTEAYAKQRLGDLLEFFETMTVWYDSTRAMPIPAVIKLAKLGGKVRKLLGSGKD
jgi:DNA-binding transcriptional regulator GbsR (MarR family)